MSRLSQQLYGPRDMRDGWNLTLRRGEWTVWVKKFSLFMADPIEETLGRGPTASAAVAEAVRKDRG